MISLYNVVLTHILAQAGSENQLDLSASNRQRSNGASGSVDPLDLHPREMTGLSLIESLGQLLVGRALHGVLSIFERSILNCNEIVKGDSCGERSETS